MFHRSSHWQITNFYKNKSHEIQVVCKRHTTTPVRRRSFGSNVSSRSETFGCSNDIRRSIRTGRDQEPFRIGSGRIFSPCRSAAESSDCENEEFGRLCRSSREISANVRSLRVDWLCEDEINATARIHLGSRWRTDWDSRSLVEQIVRSEVRWEEFHSSEDRHTSVVRFERLDRCDSPESVETNCKNDSICSGTAPANGIRTDVPESREGRTAWSNGENWPVGSTSVEEISLGKPLAYEWKWTGDVLPICLDKFFSRRKIGRRDRPWRWRSSDRNNLVWTSTGERPEVRRRRTAAGCSSRANIANGKWRRTSADGDTCRTDRESNWASIEDEWANRNKTVSTFASIRQRDRTAVRNDRQADRESLSDAIETFQRFANLRPTEWRNHYLRREKSIRNDERIERENYLPRNFFQIHGNRSTVSALAWPRRASGSSCSVKPVRIGNKAAGVPSPTMLYPWRENNPTFSFGERIRYLSWRCCRVL